MDFEDKVILITGASSGIGADAARFFAKSGGKVAMVGRNEERLNAVYNEIVEAGSPEPLKIIADVTVDAERIVNETIEHFEKVDVLINNAGYGEWGSIMDMDISTYDGMMNTNVRSVILLTQLVVPYLEKTKGNIVNISSVAGKVVLKNATFYNVTKAALDQFNNCAAVELGPKGIRVNSINPGLVKTGFLDTLELTDEQYNERINSVAAVYPLRRVGVVSDTTAAIAFLASDAASFITGVNLPVDGGSIPAGAF